MWISKRALVTIFVAGSSALSMILAVGALGSDKSHHGKRHGAPLIEESLAPSQPTDPTFHGVSPGGAPWVLKRGEVRLKSDGKLTLRVKGLVIPDPPGDGTPGQVTTISASLYCGADSDTTAADTTQQVPISRRGDARIRDTSFTVPSTCLAPVVLVHPNGITVRYIAVDGWRL
ncbi:MAG: hypothetical protein AABM31_06365 [Actinomycetota bacterium]